MLLHPVVDGLPAHLEDLGRPLRGAIRRDERRPNLLGIESCCLCHLSNVRLSLSVVKRYFARNAAVVLYSCKVLSVTEAERMGELLQYANLAKVASALNVSRQSVADWARGKNVTPFRLRQVEDLLRPQRAGESVLDPTTGELLTEMRAIRRLLQRQAKPAPVPVSREFVVAVVDGLRDVLVQREAARPGAGSRRPARDGDRQPQGARPKAPAR